MNHGGLGYINKKGYLELPPDLLELISLNVSKNLYAVFYPPIDEDNEYEIVTHPYTFMLTSVHPQYWPISARLLIFTKHRAGSYKKITECLSKYNISIIHSEVSKTGHRYASLSFFIVFEDLLEENFTINDYNFDNTSFRKTEELILHIEQELKNECGDYLFEDPTDTYLAKSINIKPNTHLAYYHYRFLKKGKQHNEIYKPFTISIRNDTKEEGRWMYDVSNQLKNILKNYTGSKYSYKIEDINEITPSILFANLDTRLLCLRFTIIPESKNHLFSVFFIRYSKSTNIKNCKGLISYVCSLFGDKFRIWWSFNSTYQVSEASESGYLVFLIENLATEDSSNVSNAKFTEIKLNILKHKSFIEHTNIDIVKVDNFKFEIELAKARINDLKNHDRNFKFQYDVFISAAMEDHKIAEDIEKALRRKGLNPFYHQANMVVGDDMDVIREALLNSRELCLVFSSITDTSLWVTQEWGIAWGLQKKIVPICTDGTLFDQLDFRIKRTLGTKYTNNDSDIEKYVESVLIRKYEYLLFSSWR